MRVVALLLLLPGVDHLADIHGVDTCREIRVHLLGYIVLEILRIKGCCVHRSAFKHHISLDIIGCAVLGVGRMQFQRLGLVAVTNRISTFYNQQNEKEYEVETSGLTVEQAKWIEQLFYSHDVHMATKREDFGEETYGSYNPTYMPQILITDFTCEIHDRDGELNSVKFTVKSSDRWPLNFVVRCNENIFTSEYNSSFI